MSEWAVELRPLNFDQMVGNDKRALEEYIMEKGWEEYLKDEK